MLKRLTVNLEQDYCIQIELDQGQIELIIDTDQQCCENISLGYYDTKDEKGFISDGSYIQKIGSFPQRNDAESEDMLQELELEGYSIELPECCFDEYFNNIPEEAKELWKWSECIKSKLNFHCFSLALKEDAADGTSFSDTRKIYFFVNNEHNGYYAHRVDFKVDGIIDGPVIDRTFYL